MSGLLLAHYITIISPPSWAVYHLWRVCFMENDAWVFSIWTLRMYKADQWAFIGNIVLVLDGQYSWFHMWLLVKLILNKKLIWQPNTSNSGGLLSGLYPIMQLYRFPVVTLPVIVICHGSIILSPGSTPIIVSSPDIKIESLCFYDMGVGKQSSWWHQTYWCKALRIWA